MALQVRSCPAGRRFVVEQPAEPTALFCFVLFFPFMKKEANYESQENGVTAHHRKRLLPSPPLRPAGGPPACKGVGPQLLPSRPPP